MLLNKGGETQMWSYNYTTCSDELYHYGVPGMKWGHRKSIQYASKAKATMQKAKELEGIGSNKASKLMAEGKKRKADSIQAKYKSKAQMNREKAERYEQKSVEKQRESNFQGAQAKVSASRNKGAKVATSILAGPFSNRTYNSVIAAGGSRWRARAVTFGTTLLGGPVGHLAVSHLFNKASGKNKLIKRF